MNTYPLLIDGEWIVPEKTVPVLEKYTGQPFAQVGEADEPLVDRAVAGALRAFKEQKLPPFQRYEILLKTSRLLLENAEDIALTIAKEAGKPLKDARGEVNRAAQTFLLSAEEAKRIHGEMIPMEGSPGNENRMAFTIRVPVGVVCAISPFNFPLNLVAHKVAPALAAGNAVVLKPATATPVTSIKLAQLLEQAGLPKGFLHVVAGSGRTVGEQLLKDQRIRFYTFTGSPPVGQHIKETVGLRRVALELGSNSATIVHEDGDLAKAAPLCARMAMANAGQVCISLQRLYVHRKVLEDFSRLFVDAVQSLQVGDPTDPATDVGPMIDPQEVERAENWIAEAVAGGAKVLTGGKGRGNVLEPTVLTDVDASMRVCREEVFAPVVSLIPYDTLDEVIEAVNDSAYGLQAGIFTADLKTAMEAARRIEVGGVIINDTCTFRADLMPYGGVKASGIGKEGPKYAIEEMTEERVIVLNL